jgi:hypothetical protein
VHYFSNEDELDLLSDDAGIQQRMVRREDAIVEQLARACRRAVETDGSDALLCGCTCMSPIAPLLQQRCEFPVIDCSLAGQAAAIAGLLAESPETPRDLSPRRGDVRRLVDALLGDAEMPMAIEDEQCEPCAVLADRAYAASAEPSGS